MFYFLRLFFDHLFSKLVEILLTPLAKTLPFFPKAKLSFGNILMLHHSEQKFILKSHLIDFLMYSAIKFDRKKSVIKEF